MSERKTPLFNFWFATPRTALCFSPPQLPSPSSTPTSKNPNDETDNFWVDVDATTKAGTQEPPRTSTFEEEIFTNLQEDREQGLIQLLQAIRGSNHDLKTSLCTTRILTTIISIDNASACALRCLYHLTFHCPSNAMKLAKVDGAILKLLEIALVNKGCRRNVAIMVMCNMTGIAIGGKEFLMEAGVVERMIQIGGEDQELESCCCCWLGLMYEMCRYSLNRFTERAIRAGAEKVLGKDKEEWGIVGMEMASEMVKMLRGEWKKPVMMKPLKWEMIEEGDI